MAEFDPSNLLYVTKDYENEISSIAKKIFADDTVNSTLTDINNELDDILKDLNTKLGFVTNKVSNVIDPFAEQKHREIDETEIGSEDLVDNGLANTASHPSINAFKSSRLDTNYKTYDFINKSIDLKKGQTIGLRFKDGDLQPEDRVHTFKVHLDNKEKVKVIEFAFTYKQSPEIVTINGNKEFREPTVEVTRVITGRFFIIRHDPILEPQEIIVKAIVNNSDNTGNLLDERIVDVAATFDHEKRSKATLESSGDVTFRSEIGPQFDLYFKVNKSDELDICIGKIMPYKWLIQKTYISDNGDLSNNYKIIRSDLGNIKINKLFYSNNLKLYFIHDKEHNKIYYTSDAELDPVNYIEFTNEKLPYDNNFFVKEAGKFVFIGNDKNCLITVTGMDDLRSMNVVIEDAIYTSTNEVMVQVSSEAKRIGILTEEEFKTAKVDKKLYVYDALTGYKPVEKWTEKTIYYEINNNKYIGIINNETGEILPKHFSDFHKINKISSFKSGCTFKEIELGEILIVSTDEEKVYYKFKRLNVKNNNFATSDDDCKENEIVVDSSLKLKALESKLQLLTSSVGTFLLVNYITKDGKISNIISLSNPTINANLAEYKNINFLKSFDTVTKEVKPISDYIVRMVETSLFTFGITDDNKLKIIDDYNVVDAVRFDKSYKTVQKVSRSSGEVSEEEVFEGYTDKNSVLFMPPVDNETTLFDNDHAYFNNIIDVYETPIGIYVLDADGVYEIMSNKSIKTRYYITQKFTNILNISNDSKSNSILISEDDHKQVLIKQDHIANCIDTHEKLRYNYIDLIHGIYQDYNYGMIDNGTGPIIDFKGKLYVSFVDRGSPLYNTNDSTSFIYNNNETFENVDPYKKHLGSFIINSENKTKDIKITKFTLCTNKYGFVNYYGFTVLNSKLDNISDINDIKNYILIHDKGSEYGIDDYRRIIFSTIKNQVKIHDNIEEKKTIYNTNRDPNIVNRIEIINSTNSPNGYKDTIEFNIDGLIGCYLNDPYTLRHGIYKRQNYKTLLNNDINKTAKPYVSADIVQFIQTRLGVFYTTTENKLYWFNHEMFYNDTTPEEIKIDLLNGIDLTDIRIKTLNDKDETIFLATKSKTLVYRCKKNKIMTKPFEDAEEINEVQIIDSMSEDRDLGNALSDIRIINNSAFFFDKNHTIAGLYKYTTPLNSEDPGHAEPIIPSTTTNFYINDLCETSDPNAIYCAMNNNSESKSIAIVYIDSKRREYITEASSVNDNIQEIVSTSRGIIAIGNNVTYLLDRTDYEKVFNYAIVNNFDTINGDFYNIKEIGNSIYTCSWKLTGNDSSNKYDRISDQPLFAEFDIENKSLNEIKLPDSRETSIYKIQYTSEGIYLTGQWNEYFIPHVDSIVNKAIKNDSELINLNNVNYECTLHSYDTTNELVKNHVAIGDSIYINGIENSANKNIKHITCKYPSYVKTSDLTPDIGKEYYILDEENTKFSAVKYSDIDHNTKHKLFERIENDISHVNPKESYIKVTTDNSLPMKGVIYYNQDINGDFHAINPNNDLIEFDKEKTYFEVKHYFKLVNNEEELLPSNSKAKPGDYLYYSYNYAYKPIVELLSEFRKDIDYFEKDSREYISTVNLCGGKYPVVLTDNDELLLPTDGDCLETENIISSIVYNVKNNNVIAQPYYDQWAIGRIYKIINYNDKVFALCENDIYGDKKLFTAEISKDYTQIYNIIKIYEVAQYEEFENFISGCYDSIDPRHWLDIFYKTNLGLLYSDPISRCTYSYNKDIRNFNENSLKGSKYFIDMLTTTEDKLYALSCSSVLSDPKCIIYKWVIKTREEKNKDTGETKIIEDPQFEEIFIINDKYDGLPDYNLFRLVVPKFITFINDQNDNEIYLFGNGKSTNILKMVNDSFIPVHSEYNSSTIKFGNVVSTSDKAYILNKTDNSEILCFNSDETITKYICNIFNRNFKDRNITKSINNEYKTTTIYDVYSDEDALCPRTIKLHNSNKSENIYYELEDYYIENSDNPIIESSVNGFRKIDKQKNLPLKLDMNRLIMFNGKTDYESLNIENDHKYIIYNTDNTIVESNVNFDYLKSTSIGLFGVYNGIICLNKYDSKVDRFVKITTGSVKSDFIKIIETNYGIFYIDKYLVKKFDDSRNEFISIEHDIHNGINFAEDFNEGLIIASVTPRLFYNTDFRKMEIDSYNLKLDEFISVMPAEVENNRYIVDISETSMGIFVTTINKLTTNSTVDTGIDLDNTTETDDAKHLENIIYRIYKNPLTNSTDLYGLVWEKTSYKNTRYDDTTPAKPIDMTQVWEDVDSKTIWLGRPGNYRINDAEEANSNISLWAYKKYSMNLESGEKAVGWRWEPVFNEGEAYEGRKGNAIAKEFVSDGMQSYVITKNFGTWMVHDEHSGQYTFNDTVSYLPKTNDSTTSGLISKTDDGHMYYPNMKLVHIKGTGDGSKIGLPSGFEVVDDLGWLKNDYMHYVKLSETDTNRLFAFKYMYDKNVRKVGYTQLYEYVKSGCSGYNYEEVKLLENPKDEIKVYKPFNHKIVSIISYNDELIGVVNDDSLGLFYSKDNGLSWTPIKNRSAGIGSKTSLFKTSTGRIIDGSVNSNGVYYSDDGTEWTISESANASLNNFFEFTKKDNETKRILGFDSNGNGFGITYSDDNGKTWINSEKINGRITKVIEIKNTLVLASVDIALPPPAPAAEVSEEEPVPEPKTESLYYSTNDGVSWTKCENVPTVINTLFVTKLGTVLALSGKDGGIYRSIDGINWYRTNNTDGSYNTIIQTSDNTLITSSNKGIELSYDDGINWINMDASYATDNYCNYVAEFSDICEIKPGIIISVSKTNKAVQYSLDYGKTWHKCNCIDGSDLGLFESIHLIDNGNVILSSYGDLNKTYISRNDVTGFAPLPNSMIMDNYHVIDSSTTDPTKQGYSPDYIKNFAVLDYDDVLFVKAFNDNVYKYNYYDLDYVITNISSKSNDVAYILKIVFDDKDVYNNLNYSTDSSELDKFVFKEVGVVDANATEINDDSIKSVTQYFLPHNFYDSLDPKEFYDMDLNKIGPKEFVVSENLKSLYQNVYKGFKSRNLINNRFIKKDQNIISDTFKHTTNRILGDVEKYLRNEDCNFRIDLSILPTEVVDNTEKDNITTKPFYAYNGSVTNVIEPFDPYKD